MFLIRTRNGLDFRTEKLTSDIFQEREKKTKIKCHQTFGYKF